MAKKKPVKKSVKSPAKKTIKKTVKKTIKKPAVKAISAGLAVVGKASPEFKADSTGGKTVNLAALRGKNVVLYFYPKDATPGCTIEGHDFSRLKPQFEKAGTEVFGISRDSIKSHEKFKLKENYTVDLLADESENVCQAFGVIKMKNMYGKKVRGIERSTFVIDRDGKLVKEWRGVKVPGHAEEVLNFVKTI